MLELDTYPDSNILESILDLLDSAGYPGARASSLSPSDKLAGGLAWCIAAITAGDSSFDAFFPQDFAIRDKIEAGEIIDAALQSVGCPHPHQSNQIQDLDFEALYPIVEWIVSRVLAMHPEGGKSQERKECDFQSYCQKRQSELDTEKQLKEMLRENETESLVGDLDHLLYVSKEKLNSAKRDLASKLRINLLLKRQVDDVPSQSELIQYEHRFSELYIQIQEKLQQTRKCYATYNALLEIKELMVKETSLLSSISTQFQDAITSTAGRTKLIKSMEGILKGIQQKLEKVQIGLQSEKKNCETLKQKYAAALTEQRRRSSLLKAIQVYSRRPTSFWTTNPPSIALAI